ncbi:hypothetical protein ACFL9T_11670 [Thermodesulfobacteriota bacterium]
MTLHKGQKSKTAVELIEEAVHLLRMSPIGTLARYYIGTFPFILFLFYFWADMSRSAFAGDRCIVSSLTLALLFIWMKFWHNLFAQKMMMQVYNTPSPAFSFTRFARIAATQCLTHATGLYILPLSLILGVPFGWSYAFYQNISVLDTGERDIGSLFGQSWAQMKLWPGQNHVILLTLSAFVIFVFLNIALSILLLPYLLNSLLGIETLFTLGGWKTALNTTFLVTAAGITYLCVDPLFKTVYLLRCFYGFSLSSGDDLKADMKRLIAYGSKILILIFFLGLEAFSPFLAAEAGGKGPMESGRQISSGELNHAIEEVMNRREFTWRMPRESLEAEKIKKTGPMGRLIEWTGKILKKGYETISRWVEKVFDWLKERFPKQARKDSSSSEDNWMGSLRVFLWVLLACMISALVWILLKTLRRRKQGRITAVSARVPSVPDMLDDGIKADDLPPNRWLALARELVEKGDFRMALRAFYLSNLAHLADHGLITIAGYKSNRDYERELHRRAHEQKELLSIFSSNIKVFERSWYGLYEVTHDTLSLFMDNQERMMAFVQK